MLCVARGLHRRVAVLRAPFRNSAAQRQVVKAQLGALSKLPYVPPADELLQTALKRSGRLSASKSIKNEAQKARNLTARQLDALTKELSVPLGKILAGFPAVSKLHPFDRALLLLTLGPGRYERHQTGVNSLRKSLLEVGKGFAAQAAKAANKADAFAIKEAGFASLQSVFVKGDNALEQLKQVAQELRRLPTVEVSTPTVALVGAPNVGKSSLVQCLSSGLPEICDYPFTTRTVKMGHFFVQGQRHQVTDTPGLLDRPDADRNAMELLTLASLQHLPTAAMFVLDLTGDCGTPVHKQWRIRNELKTRFPDKPWLDVLSKADLLEHVFAAAAGLRRQRAHDRVSGDRTIAVAAAAAAETVSQTGVPDGEEHHTSLQHEASLTGGRMQHTHEDERQDVGSSVGEDWSAEQVAAALPHAVRVSSVTSSGLAELKAGMMAILAGTTLLPEIDAQPDSTDMQASGLGPAVGVDH